MVSAQSALLASDIALHTALRVRTANICWRHWLIKSRYTHKSNLAYPHYLTGMSGVSMLGSLVQAAAVLPGQKQLQPPHAQQPGRIARSLPVPMDLPGLSPPPSYAALCSGTASLQRPLTPLDPGLASCLDPNLNDLFDVFDGGCTGDGFDAELYASQDDLLCWPAAAPSDTQPPRSQSFSALDSGPCSATSCADASVST